VLQYNEKNEIAPLCLHSYLIQAAANVVALLSTAGNVVLEEDVQGIWRSGLNWSVGQMRPAGRSLATPSVETNIPKNFKQ